MKSFFHARTHAWRTARQNEKYFLKCVMYLGMKLSFAITDSSAQKKLCRLHDAKKWECWQQSLNAFPNSNGNNSQSEANKTSMSFAKVRQHLFCYLFKLNQRESSVTKLLSIVSRFVSDWGRLTTQYKIAPTILSNQFSCLSHNKQDSFIVSFFAQRIVRNTIVQITLDFNTRHFSTNRESQGTKLLQKIRMILTHSEQPVGVLQL